MAITDGLWAFWRLGEVAGGVRADASGNGRDLSDHGGVGSVPHAFGQGAVFNGTPGQYLHLADALPPGSFSVSVWVQILGVNANPPVVGSDYWSQGSGGVDYQRLCALGSNHRFATQDPLGVWTVHGAVPVPGFHHVVGVHDEAAQTITIYLNGIAHGTLAGESVTTGADTTALGSCPDGSGANLKGVLALCGLWTRSLSGTEIAALYNGGAALDPTL